MTIGDMRCENFIDMSFLRSSSNATTNAALACSGRIASTCSATPGSSMPHTYQRGQSKKTVTPAAGMTTTASQRHTSAMMGPNTGPRKNPLGTLSSSSAILAACCNGNAALSLMRFSTIFRRSCIDNAHTVISL